jgi:pimeloyl-ACP methyl ester carboxylesterase
VAGNDPRGVNSYHSLFCREAARFQTVSAVEADVSAPQIDPAEPVAHWTIHAHGPDWQVATTYEFLRWDDIIAANMARPMWSRYPRALACFVRNLANGMVARVFGASKQYGLVYVYPTVGLLLTLVIPVLIGWGAGWIAAAAELPSVWAVIVGCMAGVAPYRPVLHAANKSFVIQLTEARLWFDDWAYGRTPEYFKRMDAFARRIISKARLRDVDEIVIVGHSGGGAIALLIAARALEIDPGFAQKNPQVVLATLGSLLPLAALHPRAEATRDAIRRVATEPALKWIDCQARQDYMNFYNFDPIEDVGLDLGAERHNPTIWKVSMKDVVLREQYRALRWNLFRMHFQFIMANDRPAHYDYFMAVCGPVAFAERARLTLGTADAPPLAPAMADSPVPASEQAAALVSTRSS